MKRLKGITKSIVIGLVLLFLGEIAIGDHLRNLGILSFHIFSVICAFLGVFCHDE